MRYLGLFGICFLAATVMPVGSEPAVGAMAALRENIWIVLLVASLGNYLGAMVNYIVGRRGVVWSLRRFFHITPDTYEKARRLYSRWGTPSLFFAWLPVVGDPLTVLAGVFKVNPIIFSLLVFPGKALRYFVVIKGVQQFMG